MEKINHFFFKEYGIIPNDINNGHCYHWAMIALCTFGGELYSNKHHAFVKRGNKYYDADILNGVDDWQKLPTIKYFCNEDRSELIPKKMTPIELKRYWRKSGKRGWSQVLIKRGIKFLKGENAK